MTHRPTSPGRAVGLLGVALAAALAMVAPLPGRGATLAAANGVAPLRSVPTAYAETVATPPTADSRVVLAYYYTWWDQSTFASTLFHPAQPYDSDDTSVMRQQVQEAKSAGIDGFVTSWYGTGDRTDVNLAKLLDLGRELGFQATIHFETPHFAPWGVADVVAQLQAFYAQRLNHAAILRYQGRPVIFFWRASTFDNATWSDIRQQVDPDHRAVWIADGDRFGILAGDAWDGISPYAIAWSANPAAQLPAWAAKARAVAPDKLWIPPVSPGCDDSAARAATCVQDRADGSYYQATLDGALSSEPSWAVIVSTFNEWLESTQIEPSVEYGDQYLQLTRQLADTFKATPPPVATSLPNPASEDAAPQG